MERSKFYDMNVLIVDDEKRLRSIIKTHLKSLFVNIYEAENGLEALRVLKDTPIDLCISDIKMPEMDGITLIKYIKEKFPAVLTLILTGYGSKENAIEAIRAKTFDFIEKPFEKEVLVNRVKNALTFKANQKLLNRAITEYVLKDHSKEDRERFEHLSIEEKNKILEGALGVIRIKELKKAA